jgi:hypothetical protein
VVWEGCTKPQAGLGAVNRGQGSDLLPPGCCWELDPPGRAVPLGRAAPPDLRGRPARLPPVPGADADRRCDHRSRRDHPDPGPSGSTPRPCPAVAQPPAATAPLPHAARSRFPSPVVPNSGTAGVPGCPGGGAPTVWPACALTPTAPGGIDLGRRGLELTLPEPPGTFGGEKQIPILRCPGFSSGCHRTTKRTSPVVS